jgi:biotin-[acetyl-CoA-carboxylase] ligase BirA-like protein
MALYTDSRDAAAALLGMPTIGALAAAAAEPPLQPLLRGLFDNCSVLSAPVDTTGWRALLVRDHAPGSQYDALVQLLRAGVQVPDAVACLARTGSGMHGFRGRRWSAHAGNIHLVVHFAPDRPIDRFDSALTALAAVSAAEAVEAASLLRAGIKWVNDIIARDCKVGGVLAFTQTRGAQVSNVVLGIGLNVETTPVVARSEFVPAASSLCALADLPEGDVAAPAITVPTVLHALLDALRRNYALLLQDGAAPLLDAYRQRSVIIGEHVTVVSDDTAAEDPDERHVIAEGRVTGIGDALELFIEGRDSAVTRGRLLLRREASPHRR